MNNDENEKRPPEQIINAPSIPSTGEVFAPTTQMRVYYSSYHLWAAKHFAQLVRIMENEHEGRSAFKIKHRAYVTSVLFSAVAFLEAAINEIFKDAANNYLSYIGGLKPATLSSMAQFWNTNDRSYVLKKYQVTLDYTGITPFEETKQPYIDVALLIKLRNVLVHYTPESLGRNDTQHKFENDLKNKFPINQMMIGSGNPDFPDKYLGYGCCEWAVRSSTNFADEFFGRIGVVPNYQRAKFDE